MLCVQPIPREIRDGDYENDMQFRQHFQDWVSAIWTAKDAKIAQLMAETNSMLEKYIKNQFIGWLLMCGYRVIATVSSGLLLRPRPA